MGDVRNWMATLWPASYKGVPFYFERDEEEGGRDNVKHEFPHRDFPFIEDMGEKTRHYSGHAYVAGDDADGRAAALIAACTAKGPGPLVVPLFGPVTVHCDDFKRKHERDRLGFVAFEVKFVRAGAASALISLGALANAAFGAADDLAGVIAATFPAAVTLTAQPDFVVASTVDGIAAGAAALDALRITSSVAPDVSAAARDQIADLIATVSTVVTDAAADSDVAAVGASLVSITRALADGMPPETAQAAMLDAADAAAPPPLPHYSAPSSLTAWENAAAAARLARLAALTAFAEALIRRTYASRPEGVTARALVVVRFDAELQRCEGAPDAALYLALQTARAAAVDYLTRLIADLKPVVTVETARILPSLVIAWRLYADPLRGVELVARNHARHPSFMPQTLEALAA